MKEKEYLSILGLISLIARNKFPGQIDFDLSLLDKSFVLN